MNNEIEIKEKYKQIKSILKKIPAKELKICLSQATLQIMWVEGTYKWVTGIPGHGFLIPQNPEPLNKEYYLNHFLYEKEIYEQEFLEWTNESH